MSQSLIPNLDKYLSISPGIDSFFHAIDSISRFGNKYPPYNIIKVKDGVYKMEFALAGFTKEDVSVTVESGFLVVSGSKSDPSGTESDRYLHRGISSREFNLRFPLADGIVVDNASMEDGMLYISLSKSKEVSEKIEIL